MTGHRPAVRARVAAPLALGAAAVLLAACGSTASSGQAPAAAATATPPLTAALAGPGGAAGAIVLMGGSAARHNNFWQLFIRPAASGQWRLATPPGMADNGGLMAAVAGRRTLAVGFGGSQLIHFSPVAVTGDDGTHWTQAAPVNPGLAASAGSLAAGPGGQMLALTRTGQIQLTSSLSSAGPAWKVLATERTLARTTAGRACGLVRLTAVAIGSGGTAVAAGACTRPGVAGVFAQAGHGGWHAAGPELPAGLARSRVTVLSLQAGSGTTSALLQAGSGPSAVVLAATTATVTAASHGPASAAGHWRMSAPQPAGPGRLIFASVSATGSAGLVRSGNRGTWLAAPGLAWRQLPALPPGTQALFAGPAGELDAVAAAGAYMTSWQLTTGAQRWTQRQRIHVQIPYGSSS